MFMKRLFAERRVINVMFTKSEGIGTAKATGAIVLALQNHRGEGGESIFLPCNNMSTVLVGAGMQESSPEEPNMHQNPWWSGFAGRNTALPRSLAAG